MTNPLVTVIMPTYNRAHLLPKSIQSVLTQEYLNFELLVCDDCSTDNTKDVVSSIPDNRIRYIRLEKNSGAPIARNTCIAQAKGSLIAFQDSDDCWLPGKLKKQVELLQTLSATFGVVYCRMARIKEDQGKYYVPSHTKNKKLSGNIHSELLKGNFVGMPTVVVRKECFETVGLFDEQLERFQDWELFIRISKRYSFLFCEETLLNSYHSKDSITTQTGASVRAMERLLDVHKDDFRGHKRSLLKCYFFAFRQAVRSRNIAATNRLCFELIRVSGEIVKDVLWRQ